MHRYILQKFFFTLKIVFTQISVFKGASKEFSGSLGIKNICVISKSGILARVCLLEYLYCGHKKWLLILHQLLAGSNPQKKHQRGSLTCFHSSHKMQFLPLLKKHVYVLEVYVIYKTWKWARSFNMREQVNIYTSVLLY